MQLLTIAARARLGYLLNESFSQAIKKYEVAVQYNKAISDGLTLDRHQQALHYSNYLVGALAILEAYLSDIAETFVTSYPGHLKDKRLTLDEIGSTGPLILVIEKAANKYITELAYNRFSVYVKELSNLFSLTSPLDEALVAKLAEIKATRDVYVHANGRSNAQYLNKAGDLARKQSGHLLPLDAPYIESSISVIETFLKDFHTKIPNKHKEYGRTDAFKEMWEASPLNRLLPFDDAWKVENHEMIRVNDSGLQRPWSHSEKPVYDFFLGIYNREHPSIDTDINDVLVYWAPESTVYQLVHSWMQAPFWF